MRCVVTFKMKRGLEVQMTVDMNINSSIINNWSCVPDTWLLIKQTEIQTEPKISQLWANRATGNLVPAEAENVLSV
jgi:hypothetical protein